MLYAKRFQSAIAITTLAAKLLGAPVRRVVVGVGPGLLCAGRLDLRLLPAMGFVDVSDMHKIDQRRRALIAIAGPGASAVLGAGLVAVSVVVTVHAASVAHAVGIMNIGIAIFNLAPLPLLDGWHLVQRYVRGLLHVPPGRHIDGLRTRPGLRPCLRYRWRWSSPRI